jgi:hypothetical protein
MTPIERPYVRITASPACRTTILPVRGRTTKVVSHQVPMQVDIPVLDDHEAPVVVRFAGKSVMIDHVGFVSESFRQWVRTIRISPRGLPAARLCKVAAPERIATQLADTICLRRFGAVAEPATASFDLDAKETISTNAAAVGRWIDDRAREMFVVDGEFWMETSAPVLAGDLLATLFAQKASVFGSGMVLREIGPAMIDDAGYGVEADSVMPAGLTLSRTILGSAISTLSPNTYDIMARCGDLAKASGLADNRTDLYEWRECRTILDDLMKLSHGTQLSGTLRAIAESGAMDHDIFMDHPHSPSEEPAIGMGF